MRLAIIGLPFSGKTTLFKALTYGHTSRGREFKEADIGVVRVPDTRVDTLSARYKPRKTTYAQVEYLDVGGFDASSEKAKPFDEKMLNLIRPVDALVLVARNFETGGMVPQAGADIKKVEAELILADLVVAEKRLTRLEEEKKKGKVINEEEQTLLSRYLTALEAEKPLRSMDEVVSSTLLKGFGFLSAKPMLWVINSQEKKHLKPKIPQVPPNTMVTEVFGQLELELIQLSPEEAEIFRADFGIDKEPALQRIIRQSYALLGLISFFTIGRDEVRAWTIKKSTKAQQAAGAVHSDMEKGFIRAEVLAYDDLIEFGSYAQAQKKGRVRLEGRDYIVQDGDIINFRFNV